MEKKIIFILEILVIIIASIYYMVKIVIPDERNKLGSSDPLIKTSTYQNMIEIKIDLQTDFALIIDKSKNISHIFFLDKTSTCLYNQSIENLSIEESLKKTIKILRDKLLLNNHSNIQIIRYSDKYYIEFKNVLYKLISEEGIITEIKESKNSLNKKRQELSLNTPNNKELILYSLDVYSRDYIYNMEDNKDFILSEENVKSRTDIVYMKLEEFVMKNKIQNLDQTTNSLEISNISSDENNKYYPNSNSWYKVIDSRVYAYIEFTNNNKKFGYCYEGAINNVRKGEC